MVCRDVTVDAELVEQRFLYHGPLAHHRQVLPMPGTLLNQNCTPTATPTFSTVSAVDGTDAMRPLWPNDARLLRYGSTRANLTSLFAASGGGATAPDDSAL
jgi:hypothetical protein